MADQDSLDHARPVVDAAHRITGATADPALPMTQRYH
jgi:hypothetical protein